MTSPEAATPTQYTEEAGVFVNLMSDMASHLLLDYSVESLHRLDQFIAENFDQSGGKAGDSLIMGVGCYVGEIIVRHLGGHWNEEGKPEINDIGPVVSVFPIDKAQKRFENGSQDSLNWYYHTIARHAYIEGQTTLPSSQRAHRKDEGLFGVLKKLFSR